MFSLIAILLAATSLGSTPQDRPDWREVDDDPDFHVALDISSISGPPTARTARSVGVSTEPEGFPGYMVLDVVFDCEARTISASGAAFFAPDGTLIEAVDGLTDTAPVSEAEGTLVAANAVCDGQMPSGPSFGSAQAYAQSIRPPAGS
ncbi:MAG: hypothetical protein Q8S53_10710 [Brevundimonas sp.]|uniref:hypothetical protein n=1 Tax=Brevundimonas sp. TaxID=1871086 RepID=UPI0027363608|nr:hypothetical protein [Brevundimonas sp.]MDP3378825.1 hypothetical protein [Brevundimonas sp.]